jgi:predicted ribosomally synthesized peptide with nif11-like leader
MSKENLVKLLEAASADEQLKQQIQNTTSYEEIKSVAGEHGFDLGDLSEEEAMRVYTLATGAEQEEGELSEGELDMVAGGRSVSGISFKVDVLSRRFGPTTKAGVGSGQGTCGCNCGNY